MDGAYSNEDGGEDQIQHYKDPKIDHAHVEFVAALRAVSKSEDEAGEKGGKIEPFEDNTEDGACGG